jgi:SAM-dependent methyltransferase
MHNLQITTLLRCPMCRSDLQAKTGALQCDSGHSFLWQENIIDFSRCAAPSERQERSRKSFGVEWNEYYPQLGWSDRESAEETDNFLVYTRAMPSFFADKIVVDAGCGNGRYIKILNSIATPRPRLIIGVDLSDSVMLAARNCAVFDNVIFLRIDLNLLPEVLKAPVDYIYSIGVLHHTPDAAHAFRSLAECVSDGGFLSMYLYGKGNPVLEAVNVFLRNRVFQSWPPKLVYLFCVLLAIPGQLFRIKFFGPWLSDLVNRFVFVSQDVHNMFDAYTAGYTSFHDRKQIEAWYRGVGFDYVVEERSNRTSLHCIGHRVPARVAPVQMRTA